MKCMKKKASKIQNTSTTPFLILISNDIGSKFYYYWIDASQFTHGRPKFISGDKFFAAIQEKKATHHIHSYFTLHSNPEWAAISINNLQIIYFFITFLFPDWKVPSIAISNHVSNTGNLAYFTVVF